MFPNHQPDIIETYQVSSSLCSSKSSKVGHYVTMTKISDKLWWLGDAQVNSRKTPKWLYPHQTKLLMVKISDVNRKNHHHHQNTMKNLPWIYFPSRLRAGPQVPRAKFAPAKRGRSLKRTSMGSWMKSCTYRAGLSMCYPTAFNIFSWVGFYFRNHPQYGIDILKMAWFDPALKRTIWTIWTLDMT